MKIAVKPLGPGAPESLSSRSQKAIDWDRLTAAEIESKEKEEEAIFCKFCEHVSIVIERMASHPYGKTFDKPVDEKLDSREAKDYHKLIKEPLCLADMRNKNAEKKYEHEKDVEADFIRIKDNWEKYWNTTGRKKAVKKEKQFLDLALLSLLDDGESASIISEWGVFREQRDSRRAWRARKAAKQAPVAPTIRQSSRLAGICARSEDEYGPDEFHEKILRMLQHTAKTLTGEVAKFSTKGLSERMRLIERNTKEPLESIGEFMAKLFGGRKEHSVLSKIIKEPCFTLLNDVCAEFCDAAEKLE